jgi:hypothetical protein
MPDDPVVPVVESAKPQSEAPTAVVESPPPSPRALDSEANRADEPRVALLRLAHQLTQTRNRSILIEYLRLRRLLRIA